MVRVCKLCVLTFRNSSHMKMINEATDMRFYKRMLTLLWGKQESNDEVLENMETEDTRIAAEKDN